jgi:hypothetical protein
MEGEMPVYVEKRGGGPKPFKIIEKESGKVVGSSETRPKAEASARARNKAYSEEKKRSHS